MPCWWSKRSVLACKFLHQIRHYRGKGCKSIFTFVKTVTRTGFMLADNPGIVNRTFENRTQSNSIHRLGSIELGNRTKSNTELCVSSIPNQSNLIEQIEPNRTQSIRLCCIEFGNRTQSTQLTGLRLIGPWPSSVQGFLVLFTIYSIYTI